MPTYEYRCDSCGEQFDVVQSFHDDPLTECANCGGELKKVFHPVGIVFRGSGFYVNDSRGSNKTTVSAKSDSSSSSSSSSDSGSDSSSGDSKSSSTDGSKSNSDGGGKKEKPAASDKAKSA